jgi:hypothetical protein
MVTCLSLIVGHTSRVVGNDDSNDDRLMTDYRINGNADGRTWFRGRYVLLGGKNVIESVVGEIYFLRQPAFFIRVGKGLIDFF